MSSSNNNNRAKNFRRHAGNDDDDDDDDTNVPTTTAANPKPKSKLNPKKLLSFADVENEPPSYYRSISKQNRNSSSSSHKITCLRDHTCSTITTTTTTSNVQPQAGTYTKEVLLELQKNTRTLAPSRSVVVLNGLQEEEELEVDAEGTEERAATIKSNGDSNHSEAERLSDEKMKKGMFEDVENERAIDVNFGEKDSSEDEDEEEKIWEEEQFRKGIGVWVAIAASVVHSVQKQRQPKFVYPAVMSVGLDAMMSFPQQAEIARKSLQENLKRLQIRNASLVVKLNLRIV